MAPIVPQSIGVGLLGGGGGGHALGGSVGTGIGGVDVVMRDW